jgi:hypothetical protein
MHVRFQVGDWEWHNMAKRKRKDRSTNTELLGREKIKKKRNPIVKCI